MKYCKKCDKWKDEGEFNKNRKNEDGLKNWCKKCNRNNEQKRVSSEEFSEKQIKFQQENSYKFCKKCENTKLLNEFYVDKTHKDGLSAYCKECKEEYNKHTKKRISERNKERRQADLQFKVRDCLRSRLNSAIRKKQKSGSAVDDLSCSIDFFVDIYIPSLWIEGMSWDNHGNKPGQWSIDHYIPLSAFDLTDREQLLKACHYTNLRPMWHIDNTKKGDTIPPEKMEEYLEIQKHIKIKQET